MKTFDIETVRSWDPCYEPERHLKSGEQYTVLSILDRKDIPLEDRLWVVLRGELLSDKLMRLFAVWCARQVQHLMQDYRSLRALEVAEQYANGCATIEELAAARVAARDAAWAAAWDAAWAAAWAAAWDAARAAARAAAWDAARAAAEDAARDVQETKLREMIIEGIKTGDTK